MSSTIIPGLLNLKNYKKINVVDVGSARASFLLELGKITDLNNVFSIGIDPVDHEVSHQYTKFYKACVDDVITSVNKKFFKNMVDDQAGSLAVALDARKSQFDSGEEVIVLNLNNIIDEQIPSEIIHFIKIDAEGRDMHIVKSLSDSNLKRIKFISVECSNHSPRFENEYTRQECIEYMKNKNFSVFHIYDAEQDVGNGMPMSDVVFINDRIL